MHVRLEADDGLAPDPSDAGEFEESDLEDPEAWPELEDSAEEFHRFGLDDLLGPWIGDEDIVPDAGWSTRVPNRGFFRD